MLLRQHFIAEFFEDTIYDLQDITYIFLELVVMIDGQVPFDR